LRRGEIRWYTFRLPDKRRPVLILTRNEVIDRLNEIIVVPATRTIRGLATEVVLTAEEGMPSMCARNFDHVALAQRSRLGPVICTLSKIVGTKVRSALLKSCGFWGPRSRLKSQTPAPECVPFDDKPSSRMTSPADR